MYPKQNDHRRQKAMEFTNEYLAMLVQLEVHIEQMIRIRVDEVVEQKLRQIKLTDKTNK